MTLRTVVLAAVATIGMAPPAIADESHGRLFADWFVVLNPGAFSPAELNLAVGGPAGSPPIGPGLVFGDFEVVSGESRAAEIGEFKLTWDVRGIATARFTLVPVSDTQARVVVNDEELLGLVELENGRARLRINGSLGRMMRDAGTGMDIPLPASTLDLTTVMYDANGEARAATHDIYVVNARFGP